MRIAGRLRMAEGLLLALNAGSSSLKFGLFEPAPSPRRVLRGSVEKIGDSACLRAFSPAGNILVNEAVDARNHELALRHVLEWTDAQTDGLLCGVGHRIVHGGSAHAKPVLLDDSVLRSLEDLSVLAPLHQPHNLALVVALKQMRPGLPQVGCFDTAFHHTLSRDARRFALPPEYEQRGMRRYGFHGLSYEYISRHLVEIDPARAGQRIIVAHLGSGASLCGLREGRSVDTTMGFSTLDGLMMGTRCGAIDAGAVLHLLSKQSLSQVEDLLYRRSGLLGVSGISPDMRVLIASSDPRAREAIDLFVFRTVREIGAMAATLGGVDGLVFTAGVGENSPEIRRLIVERCKWLGLSLDQEANARGSEWIGARDSLPVWVLKTDEEMIVAEHTFALL